jgi:hypothetical protein
MGAKQAPNNSSTEMEYSRFLVQSGLLFTYGDSGQAVAGPVLYLLTVGAKPLHIMRRISISTGGLMTITEAPTGWGGGAAMAIQPYNRMQALKGLLTSGLKGVTGGTGGAVVASDSVPVNPIGWAQAGLQSGAETILKPNTVYLLTLNLLASGNYTFDLDCYEE